MPCLIQNHNCKFVVLRVEQKVVYRHRGQSVRKFFFGCEIVYQRNILFNLLNCHILLFFHFLPYLFFGLKKLLLCSLAISLGPNFFRNFTCKNFLEGLFTLKSRRTLNCIFLSFCQLIS